MVRAMDSEHRTAAGAHGGPAGPSGAPGASMPRLVEIMSRLLRPDGCPWDREQTLDTLRPFLVEETYEVLDALSRGDVAGHCEELGDLLMQVVFQAALRAAEGAFDIDAVIASISDKLVRRHPHVFGDATGVTTSDQVLAQWDEIKRAEKAAAGVRKDGKDGTDGTDGNERSLAGVPLGPALARAQKVGSKAGKVGFDWPGWEGSFAKVEEEVREVADAVRAGDAHAKHHEIGDLLFAVVNVARKVGVDAENALIDATSRFQRRFEAVEDSLAARGKTPRTSTLEEMDALWDDVKRRETKT
jgi:MazG family protein